MNDTRPAPNHTCPICGGPNECAPARSGSFATPCWCRDVKIDNAVLERVPPEQRGVSCVCPRCAAGAITRPGDDTD
jgi:hypothetical protein